MTKKLLIAVAILAVAYVAPPAKAGEPAEGMFTVHGQIRDRYENFNNYFDGDDDNPDRLAFWATRALVGVSGSLTDSVWVAIDIQNVGTFGDRNPAGSLATFAPAPFQNFDGDFNTFGTSPNDTSLYRAVIGLNEIGGSGLSVTLGRNNKTVGGGLILGDEPFYNGNVFDGIDGTWKFDNWDIGAFAFTTSERNDIAGVGLPGNEDQKLTGVTANFGLAWDSNLEVYAVNAKDGLAINDKPDFTTIGGHWGRHTPDNGGWMWDVQLAIQNGEGTDFNTGDDFDIKGSIFDFSGGYTWANGVNHTIFGGGIIQSGDDDLTDDSDDSWHALVPTTHGRFGNADFFGGNFNIAGSGITAYHVGYAISGGENDRHKGYIKFWGIMPTEDSIDFGPGSFDIEDFGTEIDLGYTYKYDDALKLFVAVSELMPDDGLTGGGGAPDDSLMRIYGGATISFTGAKKGM